MKYGGTMHELALLAHTSYSGPTSPTCGIKLGFHE
jgi:hypothetical protein